MKHSMCGPALHVSRETSAESRVVGGLDHAGLEQRAFGRDADTAGISGVAQLRLLNELATMASKPQGHPDSGQTLTIPSADTRLDLVGWLTDHQDATDPQEWGRALGGHRWRAETASRHEVELSPVVRVMTGVFGPAAFNLNSITQTEVIDGLRQE